MVALPLGKQPTVPTEEEAGWAPGRVWTLRTRENLSQLAGMESQLRRSTCSHSGANTVDSTR